MSIPTSTTTSISDEDVFDAGLLPNVQRRFTLKMAAPKPMALFVTQNPDDLFEIYLAHLPEAHRQSHRCSCCYRFLDRFGSLVSVNEATGEIVSPLWDETCVAPFYQDAVRAMRLSVENAEIEGVFLSSQSVLGTPRTETWTHLSIDLGKPTHVSQLLTAKQAMAVKKEDFKTVQRALTEYSQADLDTVVRILESDTLYRSEKVLGAGLWLRELKKSTHIKHVTRHNNLLWRAVALAPDGFCHPRSSMLGTLLDDVKVGMLYDDIAARFKTKMNPLQYQRPQAAPTEGNIKRAEEIMEKLGLGPALPRRFARMEDITYFKWLPAKQAVEGKISKAKPGLFAHLPHKGDYAGSTSVQLPKVTMTWDKFERTVLPTTQKLEFWLSGGKHPFCNLTTAVDPAAPPILQWDTIEQRQPVAWYMYTDGSLPSSWNLTPDTYVQVKCVTKSPAHWRPSTTQQHQNDGVLLILNGAKDHNGAHCSGCLFPEFLRSELREVRATIEAYSKSNQMAGADEQTAAGIYFASRGVWNVQLRVTVDDHTSEYVIDRRD